MEPFQIGRAIQPGAAILTPGLRVWPLLGARPLTGLTLFQLALSFDPIAEFVALRAAAVQVSEVRGLSNLGLCGLGCEIA